MPEKTIREMITDYKNRLSDMSNITPDEASKILVELSALWGNVNTKLIEALMEYNKVKLDYLKEIKSVARAVVSAETSVEYQWYQEVKGFSELIKEMTRSLKYYIRSCEDEYHNN
jgi:hypothetical protein